MKSALKITAKKIVVSLLAGLMLAGCSTERSREDKVSAMVSRIDSPFLIISMTPQNLMDKSGVMDGVLPFTYELILSFFIDESVTGIDYGVKSQIVVGKGESFAPNTYGIFKVKEDAKFRDLIDKEANADIKEKDGFNYAIKESDGYCVVWNEEFAIIANIPMDFTAMLTGNGGDQGMKMVNRCIEIIKAGDEGEVNETYASFLKSEDDIAIHYDGSGFYSYMKEMSLDNDADLEKMKDTYEGVSYDLFLNFNEGSIDLNMISSITEELKSELSFIADKGVNGKLLGYAKTENPLMFGVYNVEVAGILDYMKEVMTEREYQRMEEDIQELGLEVDDAKAALTGEVVYMIDNVTQVEETIDFGYGDPYTHTRTEPIFGIAVGVLDAAIIEKLFQPVGEELLASIDSQAGEVEEREVPVFFPNGVVNLGDAYIYLQGDVLFMSNDSAWANKIAAGNGVKINDKREISKKMPFGIYVDFNAISKLKDLNDAEPYVQLFEEFYGSANIDGGDFHFILKDKETNSLRVLTEQIAGFLNELEKAGQELLEKELEESVLEGLDDLEVDLEEIEEGVEKAFDALEGN